MKIQTSELTGAALDWAVAKCEGYEDRHFDDEDKVFRDEEDCWYQPSADWAQGGPIIEREQIATYLEYQDSWAATDGNYRMPGDTPLIAAMRCYVASKLGDEADVPEGVTA